MIVDNLQSIQPVFEELQNNFKKHKTKSLEFRKTQIKSLLKGLNELKPLFEQALKKDLNFSAEFSELFSHSITYYDTEHTFQNFEKWAKRREVETPLLCGPAITYMVPEPYGVALVIASWNYPVYTSIPGVASAIAAGNCVILKPSELAPNCSNVLKQLFDSYLDPSCFRCIEGQVETAVAILKQPFDLIIFTGSPEKGKLVAAAAAVNLTPCILELGGKSPTIVDEDADLENAALRICQGRFTNSGQTCVAPDYLFVHSSKKQKLIELLKQKIKQFYGENPQQSQDYQRIITQFHTKRLHDMLQQNHEGQVIIGGNTDINDRYVEPTLIDSPSLNSKLMQEEIFGPILPIFEFNQLNEVIEFINARPKPLALYYFGSNFSKKIDQLVEQTSSGALCINECAFHLINPETPFGGVQNSGLGSCHGIYGFDGCSHLKPVHNKAPVNFWPLSNRFPPFTPKKFQIMQILLNNMKMNQGKILKWFSFIILAVLARYLYSTFLFQLFQKQIHDIDGYQFIFDQLSKKFTKISK